MKVIFRKFIKGDDVIAFLPSESDSKYEAMAYQHDGQHCEVNYPSLLTVTVPATQLEYASLLQELQRIYQVHLDVCGAWPKRTF